VSVDHHALHADSKAGLAVPLVAFASELASVSWFPFALPFVCASASASAYCSAAVAAAAAATICFATSAALAPTSLSAQSATASIFAFANFAAGGDVVSCIAERVDGASSVDFVCCAVHAAVHAVDKVPDGFCVSLPKKTAGACIEHAQSGGSSIEHCILVRLR